MTWLVILAVGLGSLALRLAPQLLLERVTLSERADRTIRHGGVAAITALIAVSSQQGATGTKVVPTLLAMLVGVVLAVRGMSLFRLLACGGATYAGAAVIVSVFAR